MQLLFRNSSYSHKIHIYWHCLLSKVNCFSLPKKWLWHTNFFIRVEYVSHAVICISSGGVKASVTLGTFPVCCPRWSVEARLPKRFWCTIKRKKRHSYVFWPSKKNKDYILRGFPNWEIYLECISLFILSWRLWAETKWNMYFCCA